jgi:acetoin utilization deacetylase AcuC-like enzyme
LLTGLIAKHTQQFLEAIESSLKMDEDNFCNLGRLGSMFGAVDEDDVYEIPVRKEVSDQEIADAEARQLASAMTPAVDSILELWSATGGDRCRFVMGPGDVESMRLMHAHEWAPGHPETPSRLTTVITRAHEELWCGSRLFRWSTVPGRNVTAEELETAHGPEFVRQLFDLATAPPQLASVDRTPTLYNLTCTPFPRITALAALRAAGSVLEVSKVVLSRHTPVAPCVGMVLIRPAAHHSGLSNSGTFCGANSVVLAAAIHLQDKPDAKILILDYDVHRSVGSEEIVCALNNRYPEAIRLVDIFAALGTGAAATEDRNIRLRPLPTGAGDKEFITALQEEIEGAKATFKPTFVIVSSGYDAAKGDKEGAQVTADGFARLAELILGIDAPILFVLEGGYLESAMSAGVMRTLEAAALYTNSDVSSLSELHTWKETVPLDGTASPLQARRTMRRD